MPGQPERIVVRMHTPTRTTTEHPMRTPTPTTLGHTGQTLRDLAARLVRRGSPRTCGHERTSGTGGRRLVLVDLDNITGMTDLHTEQWRSLLHRLRPALGATDRDHLIIAMCRRTLAQAMVALAEVPAQLLAKDGPDGAELAIDDAVDLAHAATRYTTLVIVSGDHYFTRLAHDARRRGMHVHQVASRRTGCSRALRRAATTCSELDPERLIRGDHDRIPHRCLVSSSVSIHRPPARPTTPRKGGDTMKKNSYGGSRKSGSSSTGKTRTASSGVSAARLHQRSGASNAFGGYTKVNNSDGTFRMRKTGK